MPHKHKRDKSKGDPSFYDLPPSKKAQSLPSREPTKATKGSPTTTNVKASSKPSKRKRLVQDDTPRAFTRLLTGYRPPRSGLDDGTRPSKKRKASKSTTDDVLVPPSIALPAPTIQPHEPLSSFSARVDAALPFSGLTKKGGGKEGRERQTKMEKKMQRMYKEWREEDKRLKQKREEEADEKIGEEGMEEKLAKKKGKRKSSKRRSGGGDKREDVDENDEDPWAHIKAKRIEDIGTGALVGLHDVVLAPPTFSKVPKGKENFNIGKREGGLKRQVELTEARRSVVEGYRQMMSEKRSADG